MVHKFDWNHHVKRCILGLPNHLFDDLQYCKSSKITIFWPHDDDVILEWSLGRNFWMLMEGPSFLCLALKIIVSRN